MASTAPDSDSELSTAITVSTEPLDTPFTKAAGNTRARPAKPPSDVSDRPIYQKTRNFNTKHPVVPPKQSALKRRRETPLTPAAESPESQLAEQLQSEEDGAVEAGLDDLEPLLTPASRAISRSNSRTSSVSSDSNADRKTRTLRSAIYKYYTPISRGGHEYWQCNYCTTSYKASGGSSRPKIHLQKEHQIEYATAGEERIAVRNDNVLLALSRAPQVEKEMKDRQLAEHMASSVDKNHLLYLYLRWTVPANIEFSQVSLSGLHTKLYANLIARCEISILEPSCNISIPSPMGYFLPPTPQLPHELLCSMKKASSAFVIYWEQR